MHNRPDVYRHQRAEIRLQVQARALIELDDGALRCAVRNVSAGGVEVFGHRRSTPPGTRAQIVLLADGIHLGPLRAELVRHTNHGVAFRFLDVDAPLRKRILSALALM
jgi:hypothetical protein